MRWLLVLIVLILLFGPLRKWLGRHWAFLFCVVAGAVFGLMAGAMVLGTCGGPAFLPLVWAIAGAVILGRVGPSALRNIERDGKK